MEEREGEGEGISVKVGGAGKRQVLLEGKGCWKG